MSYLDKRGGYIGEGSGSGGGGGTTVVANPGGTGNADLLSIRIDGTPYDITGSGGTTVVANPGGSNLASLTSITIDGTSYSVAALVRDGTLAGAGTTASPLRVANEFTQADEAKLDGIAAGATAGAVSNATLTGLGTAASPLGVLNEFTQGHENKLNTVANGATAGAFSDGSLTGLGINGNPLRVANPFTDADELKLDGIAVGATAGAASDSSLTGAGTTASPLRVANPFTNFDEAKLDAIEASATRTVANSTASATHTLVKLTVSGVTYTLPSGGSSGLSAVSSDGTLTGQGTGSSVLRVANPFTDADELKLDGIAAQATAGAFSDSTLTGAGTAASLLRVANPFTEADEAKLDSLLVVEANGVTSATTALVKLRVGGVTYSLPSGGSSGLSAVSSDASLAGTGTASSPLRVANEFTAADEAKLDGIAGGATNTRQPSNWASEGDNTLIPAAKLGNVPARRSDSEIRGLAQGIVSNWAEAGNSELIPAEKLTNAPSGGGGTAVVANPAGTDGSDLNRVTIGGVNYNIGGGGGGGASQSGWLDLEVTSTAGAINLTAAQVSEYDFAVLHFYPSSDSSRTALALFPLGQDEALREVHQNLASAYIEINAVASDGTQRISRNSSAFFENAYLFRAGSGEGVADSASRLWSGQRERADGEAKLDSLTRAVSTELGEPDVEFFTAAGSGLITPGKNANGNYPVPAGAHSFGVLALTTSNATTPQAVAYGDGRLYLGEPSIDEAGRASGDLFHVDHDLSDNNFLLQLVDGRTEIPPLFYTNYAEGQTVQGNEADAASALSKLNRTVLEGISSTIGGIIGQIADFFPSISSLFTRTDSNTQTYTHNATAPGGENYSLASVPRGMTRNARQINTGISHLEGGLLFGRLFTNNRQGVLVSVQSSDIQNGGRESIVQYKDDVLQIGRVVAAVPATSKTRLYRLETSSGRTRVTYEHNPTRGHPEAAFGETDFVGYASPEDYPGDNDWPANPPGSAASDGTPYTVNYRVYQAGSGNAGYTGYFILPANTGEVTGRIQFPPGNVNTEWDVRAFRHRENNSLAFEVTLVGAVGIAEYTIDIWVNVEHTTNTAAIPARMEYVNVANFPATVATEGVPFALGIETVGTGTSDEELRIFYNFNGVSGSFDTLLDPQRSSNSLRIFHAQWLSGSDFLRTNAYSSGVPDFELLATLQQVTFGANAGTDAAHAAVMADAVHRAYFNPADRYAGASQAVSHHHTTLDIAAQVTGRAADGRVVSLGRRVEVLPRIGQTLATINVSTNDSNALLPRRNDFNHAEPGIPVQFAGSADSDLLNFATAWTDEGISDSDVTQPTISVSDRSIPEGFFFQNATQRSLDVEIRPSMLLLDLSAASTYSDLAVPRNQGRCRRPATRRRAGGIRAR